MTRRRSTPRACSFRTVRAMPGRIDFPPIRFHGVSSAVASEHFAQRRGTENLEAACGVRRTSVESAEESKTVAVQMGDGYRARRFSGLIP